MAGQRMSENPIPGPASTGVLVIARPDPCELAERRPAAALRDGTDADIRSLPPRWLSATRWDVDIRLRPPRWLSATRWDVDIRLRPPAGAAIERA